ncbi:C6 zinc finger domain-containing protein [Dothistroma septosporum NZE10]|uniref:C6 zinc finger domain-containing protein n=1 Tax=Dothistroma septosporum (strain NZE10 / CBS 128990) TaxID=675120 RepID=N1PKG1_DOTSN|nr:C6 zinc finger domain-containing protein [Dothistroma septosporum NZE10]
MSLPAAVLSCQQCTRRKTKCDKQLPTCTACLRAGLACTTVQRHRLPRGRTGKTAKVPTAGSQALRDRIGRLEAIVTSLQHKPTTAAHPHEDHGMSESPSTPAQANVDSFIAPDFWAELTETVAGLRSVLDDPDTGDGLPDEVDSASPTSLGTGDSSSDLHVPASADSHVILFGASAVAEPTEPTAKMKAYLLGVFKARVDTIFKVLHWPSTVFMLKQDSTHIDYSDHSKKALASAIYFTAVCSLMNHELNGRNAVVEQYRRNAEEALVRANLLSTRDFITLQAFVIYLAGLRACQANAQQWTLTAVAIRLASTLGLGNNMSTTSKLSPLEGELRHRLWSSIGVLDMQSAFDRGSKPLLSSNSFPIFPSNVNDADMSHQSLSLPPPQSQFSEMSFSLLVYHAGLCQRKLTEIGSSAAEGTIDPLIAGYEQVGYLADFERYVRRVVGPNGGSGKVEPIQDFTVAVAEESLVAMRLLLYRPLHKRGNGYVPPEYSPTERFDLLATATEVLERSQSKRSWIAFAQWAWFSWVKWYALAVVLAELCYTHGELADRAWRVAQASYDNYAKVVADTKSGLLWKPIMRLMRKVQQVRGEQRLAQQTLERNDTLARYQYWSDGMADATTPANMLPTPASSAGAAYSEHGHTAGAMEDPAMMYQQQAQATADDMSWLHWDLLIDDINESNVNDMVW